MIYVCIIIKNHMQMLHTNVYLLILLFAK